MELKYVTLSVVAVVVVRDGEDAEHVARSKYRDILRDAYEETIEFNEGTLVTSENLPSHGWDEWCIPYGHERNTSIKYILAEMK